MSGSSAGGRPRPVTPVSVAADLGLPLGQIIPGTQYRVLTKLGTGGMGTVYAAEHVQLEKRVAIKVLRADVAHTAGAIDRLRDEARAASKIGSQFICDVTDFGQIPDGRVFFVMEYLEGQSLGKALKSEGAMAPERALPILRQICKALEAAHEKGIVHLDMKPDNVMLLGRGRRQDAVKVVDFGVARLMTSVARREDKVSGTPEYISPERFLGAAYDHRADIYALGVLGYEALTGMVPFRGTSYLATLTMHVQDAPPSLDRSEVSRTVPGQLAQVILQMLEKDPAARPASMAVVEAMLCEAQIASRPAHRLGRPGTAGGRRDLAAQAGRADALALGQAEEGPAGWGAGIGGAGHLRRRLLWLRAGARAGGPLRRGDQDPGGRTGGRLAGESGRGGARAEVHQAGRRLGAGVHPAGRGGAQPDPRQRRQQVEGRRGAAPHVRSRPVGGG